MFSLNFQQFARFSADKAKKRANIANILISQSYNSMKLMAKPPPRAIVIEITSSAVTVCFQILYD
jgi:hypothetical protein